MIWALWHSPMILILGFGYGREMWPGVLLHFILVTSLGIWMGYIWFKTRSTILAAFIHAVFNAHAYGGWSVILVSDSKLIVGAIGLVNALLLGCLGLITIWRARSQASPANAT
jgi:membrane protease YdiL (CAAX protease family)